MMTIKEIRAAALKAKDKNCKAIDHKTNFTEQQLAHASTEIDKAIAYICLAVGEKPNRKHTYRFFIGNKTWSIAKLENYIHLCNNLLIQRGYADEIEAKLTSFSNEGDPNAYCPANDLVRYFAEIKER